MPQKGARVLGPYRNAPTSPLVVVAEGRRRSVTAPTLEQAHVLKSSLAGEARLEHVRLFQRRGSDRPAAPFGDHHEGGGGRVPVGTEDAGSFLRHVVRIAKTPAIGKRKAQCMRSQKSIFRARILVRTWRT